MSDLTIHEHNLSLHSSFHELAEAHVTTSSDISTASAAGIALPGMSFTIQPTDPRPYRVRFGTILYGPTTGVGAYLDLREDGVLVARTGLTIRVATPGVSWRRGQRRFMPAQVAHTYALYLLSANGIATVHALSDTTAGCVTFMQAVTG